MNYYDEISEGYEELHKEEQEKKIALIKEKLKINPEDKLLDVGCGTGLTTRPWKCKRYGIDPAKKLLEKAKAADPEGTYELAPAENIPFNDNEFDIVISITAIQNFEDIEKGLNEIKRVGKGKFKGDWPFLAQHGRHQKNQNSQEFHRQTGHRPRVCTVTILAIFDTVPTIHLGVSINSPCSDPESTIPKNV